MVVADIAALMSSQFKSLAIIIAKRIVDQAWVVWGPLFPREADGWKIGQKRENRRNQGWGVVVRGQHTVTAGARRSRRHQMGKPCLETTNRPPSYQQAGNRINLVLYIV